MRARDAGPVRGLRRDRPQPELGDPPRLPTTPGPVRSVLIGRPLPPGNLPDRMRTGAQDFMWATVGASDNPCSNSYHGPSAFSEAITTVIADYTAGLDLRLYIDHHCCGPPRILGTAHRMGYTYAG